MLSTRLPSPTNRLPNILPLINEHANSATISANASQYNPTPYHPVDPNYIRGITGDGKKLVARSIMKSPDGIFHIQMQVVGFPGMHAPGPLHEKQQLPAFNFPSYHAGSMLREHVTTRDMNGFKVEEVRLVRSDAREGSHESRSDGGYSERETLTDGEPGGVVYEREFRN
jgi:hypothetical protein